MRTVLTNCGDFMNPYKTYITTKQKTKLKIVCSRKSSFENEPFEHELLAEQYNFTKQFGLEHQFSLTKDSTEISHNN